MAYITDGKSVNTLTFIKKRAVRIIPVYWILTTVALIVFLISPSSVNSTLQRPGIINSYFLYPVEGLSMLLAVAWTLRYEFIFYVIFAICLKTGHRYIYASIILFAMWFGSLFNHDNFYVNFILSEYMLEFLLGIASFLVLKSGKEYVAILFSIILCIMIFFGFENHWHIITAINCFMIVLISTNSEKAIIKLKLPFMKYVGDSSYSLYLSHLFVIAALGIIAKKSILINHSVVFFALNIIFVLAFSSFFMSL